MYHLLTNRRQKIASYFSCHRHYDIIELCFAQDAPGDGTLFSGTMMSYTFLTLWQNDGLLGWMDKGR